MIVSTYNSQLKILMTEFKGEITAKEVVDYLITFKENNDYPRKLKSIVDATNASFKFSFKNLKGFNKAKTESLENYDIVISAIIINNPATAAISTLYGAIANNRKHKYKVFSTHEAALIWTDSFNF